jgi:hypothetical protein
VSVTTERVIAGDRVMEVTRVRITDAGQQALDRPKAPTMIATMSSLILKRASASRTSGEWREDHYDVLAEGIVVGRIMKAAAAPLGTPWFWKLAYGHRGERTLTHG